MNKTSVFKIIIISILAIVAGIALFFYDKTLLCVKRTVAIYYIYSGDEHYREGRHQETLENHDKSVEEYQKALDDYNYALRLYPEHANAQYNLGNIYYSKYEDFFSAINCYEKTLSIKPDYIKARINLGNVLVKELHDLDRAINEYSFAVRSENISMKLPFGLNFSKNLKLNKAVAYYNLGVAYKSKSLLYPPNTPEAREYLLYAAECYKKSIELDPDNFSSHYNLAITLHLLKEHYQAIKEYCIAIKLAPSDRYSLGPHYNLAIILKGMGKYSDAVAQLQITGIILGANGENDKVQMVYDLLNDTTQRANIEAYKKAKNHKNDKVVKNDDSGQVCDICCEYNDEKRIKLYTVYYS